MSLDKCLRFEVIASVSERGLLLWLRQNSSPSSNQRFSRSIMSCCPPILGLFLILGSFVEAISDTDVIIVGGGTAGCVLAARLCASLPGLQFTLVERANPRSEMADFIVRAPALAFSALSDPELLETMITEPEPSLENRSFSVRTGATLGGSSSVNGMQWVAPLRGDVRRWKVSGLNESNVNEYSRRAFKQSGFASQHGEFRQLYTDDILKAGNRAGFVADNGPFDRRARKTIFEDRVAVNASGVRQDSCTAYLSPVQDGACAKNLLLIQGITVTRILFRRERFHRKLQAHGVEYVYSNDTESSNRMVVHARKRIILAAGPFGSPKLLQLSGIGPRRVLNGANIKVLKNLPVGKSAQARAILDVTSSYSKQLPLDPLANESVVLSAESIEQWRSGKGGPLGAGKSAINGRLQRDAYILGSFAFSITRRPPDLISEIRKFRTACFSNPTSFGSLEVQDDKPFTAMTVKLRLLSQQIELDRMKRCLKSTVDVHRSFDEEFKMRTEQPLDVLATDDFIKQNARPSFHLVGGNAVGIVLNSKLMVRGTRGLYVVDASALRRMPWSAGPLASVYTLAEFMAERIVQDLREI